MTLFIKNNFHRVRLQEAWKKGGLKEHGGTCAELEHEKLREEVDENLLILSTWLGSVPVRCYGITNNLY